MKRLLLIPAAIVGLILSAAVFGLAIDAITDVRLEYERAATVQP